MKRILRVVIAVLLGGIVTVGVNRPIQAQGVSQQAKAEAAAQAAANASAKGQSLVNVIVGLSLSSGYAPEKSLGVAQILSQRGAIGAARAALAANLQGLGATEYASWPTLPYVALKVPAAALDQLVNSPLVSSIQEDRLSAPSLASSTALIGSDLTVASGFRGDDWAVVILDTGIDTNHPFYSGRVVWQACFSAGAGGATLCPNGMNTQSGPGAADVTTGTGAPIANCNDGGNNICDHGSHVAGIAAGEDSGVGYNGVAPGAFIIAIQVFTRFNNDGDCGGDPGDAPCVKTWDSDQISALNYVNTTLVPLWDIASINMSLGGGQSVGACDGDGRKAPIDALLLNGVATVIAAGNDDWTDTVSVPGCISTAVTVGGVFDNDTLNFNNGGPVDILAPGVDVDSSTPNDTFESKGGTSMATPHVTGAFAVIRNIVGASWSVGDILTLLQNTGPLITDMRAANNPGGGGTLTGYVKPRLQLDAAVADLLPADLRVLKDCKPDSPFPAGTTADCTIFVDNLGPAPAINVELVDELVSDGSFTIGTVTTDTGSCTKTATTVTCDLNNMAAGQRATIVVPISALTPQSVSDTASVSSDTDDPDHNNDVASDVLNFVGSADLSIAKVHAPEPVTAGENLTYTLTIHNSGPSAAPGVVVTDVLPIEVSLISATPSFGTCGGAAVLTCDLGSMSNGVTRTITVIVNVKPDTPDGAIIVNNASVDSDALDPDNSDNVDSSPATVQARADLRITKTDSPDPVIAGANLTYVLSITNLGPSTARTVVVADTLPAGLTYLSATIGGGSGSCSLVLPNNVSCSLGDLANLAVRTVTIQSLVSASLPDTTVLHNTASVSSTTIDPVAGNNSASADTDVDTRADLWMDKTVETLTGGPQRTTRFTLYVYNKPGCEADDQLSCGTGGPSDAQHIVVTDQIPSDPKKLKVVFVSQNCTYDLATHRVTCSIPGSLPVGQFATFIIDVQSSGNLGNLTNTASLTSATTDPNVGNNSDSVQFIIRGGSNKPGQ